MLTDSNKFEFDRPRRPSNSNLPEWVSIFSDTSYMIRAVFFEPFVTHTYNVQFWKLQLNSKKQGQPMGLLGWPVLAPLIQVIL